MSSNIYLQAVDNKIHKIPIVNELEISYVEKLTNALGYDWAVRFEDFCIIITSMLFAMGLSFFFFCYLFKGDLSYTVRFSDTLEGFVYMWAERGGIKEVVVKKPKTFRDRIEVAIAFFWIRFFDHIPLRERNARFISLIIIILSIIIVFSMVVFLLFTFNVLYHSDFS